MRPYKLLIFEGDPMAAIATHFSEYIRNIAFFLIFMTLVELVMPHNKYSRYVNLAMGFVLIFLVLSPLQGIIGAFSSSATADDVINGLTNNLSGSVISQSYNSYTDDQKTLVLNELKTQLNGQIEAKVNSLPDYSYVSSDVDVSVDNAQNVQVNSVSVVVSKNVAAPTQAPIVRVEPVTIDSVSVFSPQQSGGSGNVQDDEDIQSIKKLIADFYNLSDNNIYIQVNNNNE